VSWRTAGIGASRPLPRIPAKVPSLNRQRPFSLGGGNGSSCPIADARLTKSESASWDEERAVDGGALGDFTNVPRGSPIELGGEVTGAFTAGGAKIEQDVAVAKRP